MKNAKRYIYTLVLLASCMTPLLVFASPATIPNKFTAGSPAIAAEVNENFDSLKTSINDNDAKIAALRQTIADLQSELSKAKFAISTVQNSNIMAMEPYVTLASTSYGPKILFYGVNIQLVNNTGSTSTPNGLGNLIVGYDNQSFATIYFCTHGNYKNETDCTANGYNWTTSSKSGSHNIIVGDENSYSYTGGLVAGFQNIINNKFSVAIGGRNNRASGFAATTLGGSLNNTTYELSTVSGGIDNEASFKYASVHGGWNNLASGDGASVSGGSHNWANGNYSSISGGEHNQADAAYASASGGRYNHALGEYSSISGGYDNWAGNYETTIVGGESNSASGKASSILGGFSQRSATDFGTVPGLP